MGDKMQHEEYQYPGDEYVTTSPETTQQPEAAEEESAPVRTTPAWQRFILLNKRKLFMLGIVLVGVVSFQVMHHKAEPVATLPSVTQPVVAAPVATNNDDQLLLQKSLAELQQSNDSNNQEIVNLKTQLATVNDQLQASNETNQQLKQAMVLLLQELRNLNEEMAKKTVAKPAAHHPEVVYVVRAMVEGRAWIQGSNGLSQSVTIGDPIPAYGNVTAIKAAQGVIMTTSGKEIRLGANDY